MHQATHISPSDIKPVLGVLKSILGAFAHASKASHTHAGTHAHTHTQAHAHTQAQAGANARTCAHTRIHI